MPAKGKKVPVIVSFQALDQVSEPLRKLNQRLENTFKPVKNLQNQFSRFGKASGLTTLLAGARTAAIGAAAAVATLGFAAYKGFQKIIQSNVEANSTLAEMSERTKFSVADLQKWRYVAEQSGASTETLDAALIKFSKTLSMTRRGQGELVGLLGKDSGFLTKLNGIKSTSKAFEYFVKQLRAVPNEADRITLLTAAFGRGADELVNMTYMTEEETSALMKEREAIGLVSQEQADAFKTFGDLEKKISTRFAVLTTIIGSKLLPTFEALFTRFDAWIERNRPQLEQLGDVLAEALPPVLELIIMLLKNMWETIKPFFQVAGMIYKPFSKALQAADTGPFTFGQGPANGGPSLSQAAVGPALPGYLVGANAGAAQSQAQVTVTFENAPKGMRVAPPKSFGSVLMDMSVGYAMGNNF